MYRQWYKESLYGDPGRSGGIVTARYLIGDVLEVLPTLEEKSVDLILTSPPFLALRSYLPANHPDKAKEGGSQSTPGEYIDWLLDVVAACDRVLAPHGSMVMELGDTYSGSGGAGGDYAVTDTPLGPLVGLRAGQPKFDGSARRRGKNRDHWPADKSLCCIPELFRISLVYGFNPLTGREVGDWRLRNVVRWVRPNPPVGALGDKFRPATSELMVFCRTDEAGRRRFFDLDAVREPYSEATTRNHLKPSVMKGQATGEGVYAGPKNNAADHTENMRFNKYLLTQTGAPPLDWWNIPLLDGEELCETCGGVGWFWTDAEHSEEGKNPCPSCGGSGIQGATRYGPKERPITGGPGGAASKSGVVGQGVRLPIRKVTHEGSPPLDWWNIPPGGYQGAHYAVFPEALCVRPIKAMSPERVCRTCGEPSRRIVSRLDGARSYLSAEIERGRLAAGLSQKDVAAWFPSVSGGLTGCVWNWENAKNVPTVDQWPILRDRLGLSSEFDDLIEAESRWNDAEYVGGTVKPRIVGDFMGSGSAGKVDGGITRLNQTFEWSDCSHDNYRPGLVLDPFAGSGTTLAVAVGHGRDAIGIDLDERNARLAEERIGMFLEVVQ